MAKIDLLKPLPANLFRTGFAQAIEAGASRIDREGGDNGVGLISGMAVITRGEALGHGFWVDAIMVSQVAAQLQATADRGIKSRFTHPSMSDDGVGKRLGQVKAAVVDGDITRGDLHFSKASTHSPDGNLAEYVMDLAEEAPATFGTSIAFDIDWDATFEHWKACGGIDDSEVMQMYLYGYSGPAGYQSDDELNVKNLVHVRLKELRSVDVVDEPAANAGGLFHANQIPVDAEKLLAFSLGLTRERPPQSVLGIDSGRVAGMFQKFMQKNNLRIIKGGSGMALSATTQDDTKSEEEQNKEGKAAETPGTGEGGDVKPEGEGGCTCGGKASEGKPEDSEGMEQEEGKASAQNPAQAAMAKLQKFTKRFGAVNGGKWFSEGKTYTQALELHSEDTDKKYAALNSRVTQAGLGEAEAASFTSADAQKSQKEFAGLNPTQNAFANTLKFPNRN